MPKMKVLDTSAILRFPLDFSGSHYILPDSVLDELEKSHDENAKTSVGVSINKSYIKISNPSAKTCEHVRQKASDTGDIDSLSDTDIEVLALAFERSCPLISDDYAIQNVASYLKIPFESMSQDGIKKMIRWVKKCTGCGKIFKGKAEATCDVCGSKLRKIASK